MSQLERLTIGVLELAFAVAAAGLVGLVLADVLTALG